MKSPDVSETTSALARAYWSRLGYPAQIVTVRAHKDGGATIRWRDLEDGEVGDFHISAAALRADLNRTAPNDPR